MSDWKSRATDVTHLYNQKNLNSDNTEDLPISKTESALRGAAQGASLGFADEIAGGGEALLDQLLGSDQTLGEAYRQHRDESRQAYKAAEEANPKTFIAGTVAGGLATPIPFSTEGNLLKAVGTGAAIGAAGGLGAGEADLTKGDMGGALSEMKSGAEIGSAGGALFHGLAKIPKALSNTTASKAYELGKQGENLLGKANRQRVGSELVDYTGNLSNDIQSLMDLEAGNKRNLLKAADEQGKIDLTDFFNKILPSEESKLPKALSSKDEAARNTLKDVVSRAKSEGTDLSPSEIDNFRKKLSNIGFEEQLTDEQVNNLAKRLSGKLSETLNNEPALLGKINPETGLNELGQTNKNIEQLKNAQDIFNIGKGKDELGNEISLTPLIQKLESENASSDIARAKFKEGLESLKAAAPEFGKKTEEQAMAIANKYDTARSLNQPISLTANPAEMVKRASGMAGNVAGLGMNKLGSALSKVTERQPGKILSTAYNATPEFINSMAMKLESKNSKFAPVLRNIANQPEAKRKALMFSLMQQPAFREMIEPPDTGDGG